MATIGFIGLGNMGAPMAANLVRAGHQVTGFDLVPGAMEALATKGGHAVASVAEAAGAGDIVITMLPAGPQVRSVYLDEGGVLASARRGALLIDCSTIDVETARAVAAAAKGAGFDMLDAPVSGGVAGAEAASLTFMVGGDAEIFARAQPVLAAMGRTIVHAGPAGNGQAAKICNNMILGVSMIAVCEAFSLAERLGLEAQTLVRHQFQIIRAMLGADELLPGAGTGPGVAGEPRLRTRLHRGDDAEGSAARAAGGGRHRDGYPARRSRRQSLPVVRRWGRRRSRFFRDLSLNRQIRR